MSVDKGEKGASHPDGVPGKYEYPALDAEPGYWAEKWAEFKWRLAKSWRESYVTEVLCLNMALWIIFIIGHHLLGWR